MSNRDTARSLYLAKAETTSGTDAAPTAVANSIALKQVFDPGSDFAFRPDRQEQVGSGHLSGEFPYKPKGEVVAWPLALDLRGRQNAMTTSAPIEADPILRAMGWSPVYVATGGSEQVTYVMASSGFETMTQWKYIDGKLYKAVGCAADGGLAFDVGGPCVLSAATQGKFSAESDTAVATGSVYPTVDGPVATDATSFTVGGFATGIIRKFSLSLGNPIVRRDGVLASGGVQGYAIRGKRRITWECVLEDPLVATADFKSMVRNQTASAIGWVLGTTQYNILELTTNGNNARLTNAVPSSDGGTALVTLSGVIGGQGDCLRLIVR